MAQLSAAPQAVAISLNLQMPGVLGHHDQRLGRAAQHGGELRGGRLVRGELVRVDHREDEVDVGQTLLQRRHLLHVRQDAGAALAGPGTEDVDAVGAGAVVDAAGGQLEAGRLAARCQDDRARRRGERVVHEGRRDAHARAVHGRAGASQEREGLIVPHLDARRREQLQRGVVNRGAATVIESPRVKPVLWHRCPPCRHPARERPRKVGASFHQ